MADLKVSELGQLTGAGSVAATDECLIVDKSDTSMAGSGTDKRITFADLASAVYEQPLAATTGSPSAPSSGVRLFGRTVAGRDTLAMIDSSGLDTMLQPNFSRNAVSFVRPNGNSTTLASVGLALTAVGTATAANWASTNLHTSMRRVDYLVTTAATTAVAGFRGAAQQFWRGNAADLGGFFYVCRWAPATGQSTSTKRAFAGLRATAANPTDVNPSTLTDMIGMGKDATDSNWQFMYNDNTGTASKVDLGGSFAVSSTDRAKVYEISLFCAPNGSTIYYQVVDLTTAAIASGSVTTDIPSSTTALNPIAYCSVGGTSSVIGLTLFGLYIETDN